MRINSFVDAKELKHTHLTLSAEESHHVSRVLRAQCGQEITLFDGQGGVAEATIESITKTAVEVHVSKRWEVPPPAAQIDLIQALPKPDRWELVLQKAVELGASSIQPVITRHTEIKATAKKEDRWQKIVLNAAQQCEVRWLPTLHPVVPFEAILSKLADYDYVLLGSLYVGAMRFQDIELGGKKKVALLIGPEGDFTPEEVDAAVRVGAIPVSFGERILRTETAAIFGLSVLTYQLL